MIEKKPYCLYKIINNFDSKVYIGVTKDPMRRWHSHVSPKSKCPKLRNAIQKYGRDNFEMVILCIGIKPYILGLEKKLITSYNSTKEGYNVHEGGKELSSEHFIKNSKKLEPVYAKGFWFPNREQALASLNITDDVFRRWSRQGKLETFGWGKEYGPSAKPLYVSGFWFLSVDHAASVLGISRSSAWRMSKLDDGGLVLIKNTESQRKAVRKRVSVYGQIYESVNEARLALGVSKRTFSRRLQNHPDFKILQEDSNP